MAQKQQSITESMFGLSLPTTPEFGGQMPVQRSNPSDFFGSVNEQIRATGRSGQAGLRRLFGQQTPQEATVQKTVEQEKDIREAILTFQASNPGIDMNTPQALKKLANHAVTINPDLRMFSIQLNQRADALQSTLAANQRKMKKEDADLAKVEAETALKNYQLNNPEKKPPTQSELLQTIAVIKSNENSTDKEKKYADELIKVIKLANPLAPMEDFDKVIKKETAKQYVKQIPEINRIITSAKQALSIVNRPDKIISGGLAPELELEFKKRTMNNKYLGRILGTSDSKQQVINTQLFLNTVKEQVLPGLQQFGGNDSNSEKDFLIELSSGSVQLDIETIKANLQRIIEKETKHKDDLNFKVNQIKSGKTININRPLVVPKVPETLNNKKPISEMTEEEIKQELGQQ